MFGQEVGEEYWVVGKRSVGYRGFAPLWERTQPPRLEMLEQIKDKSLDELEDLIAGFSREYAGEDGPGDAADVSSDDSNSDRSPSRASTRRSESELELELDEAAMTMTASSGSIFVPSASER